MDIDRLRKLCLSFPGATEQIQWENDLVFKVAGKMFAVTPLIPARVWLSLKADPEAFAELTERLELYFYEESGWLLIFTANAIASAYLYMTVGGALGDRAILLVLNMLFGLAYLPFETLHLASLRA